MSGICPHIQFERELLRRAKRREADATEALLHRYRPLVESRARSFACPMTDRDDLIQEGMLSLFNAIQRYDENRSIGFAAYAQVCVERRLITLHSRSVRRRSERLESASRITTVQPKDLDLYVIAASISLTRLEREVLAGFRKGLSYEDIAAHLKCSIKSVDNALQRIRRKARLSSQN